MTFLSPITALTTWFRSGFARLRRRAVRDSAGPGGDRPSIERGDPPTTKTIADYRAAARAWIEGQQTIAVNRLKAATLAARTRLDRPRKKLTRTQDWLREIEEELRAAAPIRWATLLLLLAACIVIFRVEYEMAQMTAPSLFGLDQTKQTDSIFWLALAVLACTAALEQAVKPLVDWLRETWRSSSRVWLRRAAGFALAALLAAIAGMNLYTVAIYADAREKNQQGEKQIVQTKTSDEITVDPGENAAMNAMLALGVTVVANGALLGYLILPTLGALPLRLQRAALRAVRRLHERRISRMEGAVEMADMTVANETPILQARSEQRRHEVEQEIAAYVERCKPKPVVLSSAEQVMALLAAFTRPAASNTRPQDAVDAPEDSPSLPIEKDRIRPRTARASNGRRSARETGHNATV